MGGYERRVESSSESCCSVGNKGGVDRGERLTPWGPHACIREITLDRCLWAKTLSSGRFLQNCLLDLLKTQDFNLGITSSRASSQEDFLTGGKPEEKPQGLYQWWESANSKSIPTPGCMWMLQRQNYCSSGHISKQKQAVKPRPKNSTT